ncbi:MAG: redoxin domain-containing protein [Betaproteobacteria bacterium]|nr:redoxin domain-containing protein [Betaproteobacteria bacterium]
MKESMRALVVLAALVCGPSFAAAVPGKPAPDFSLADVEGRTHRLADYRGRFVVLEWFNRGCPFVQKHYESGNMQALQGRYAARNVVWLTVNSTSRKHADYRDAEHSRAIAREWKMRSAALMLDEDGRVGRAFGAKATPHMFVIDPEGTVIYAGAIDDMPTWRQEDIARARNFVAAALDEALAGKAVSEPSTTAYGCSVKY